VVGLRGTLRGLRAAERPRHIDIERTPIVGTIQELAAMQFRQVRRTD